MSLSSIRMIRGDYSEVDPSSVRRLQSFRQISPPKSASVGKYVYRYWELASPEAKHSETAVLFLPAAMGHGEVWFSHMLHLYPEMRTLAFSYPENPSMPSIAADIVAIARQRGVKKAIVVGHSIGGIIAQSLTRQYPAFVSAMVLITSGCPSTELPAGERKIWTDRKKMIPRLTLLPYSVIRQQLAIQAFEDTCPEEYQENMRFYRAYIEETYLTYAYKRQYIALGCRAMPNAYKNPLFSPGDLPAWHGKTLLCVSEADQMYGEPERSALRSLYPDAQLLDLGDTGQFGAFIHQEKICDAIKALAYTF